jgi:hypothetical protein
MINSYYQANKTPYENAKEIASIGESHEWVGGGTLTDIYALDALIIRLASTVAVLAAEVEKLREQTRIEATR